MICEHRDANGIKMQTWLHRTHTVCRRCVGRVREDVNPIRVAQMMAQMDYAEIEMRAMTGMMQEVGMEFFGDEVMGTVEQFEEFKKRWTEKYPDRSFTAMYGSKGVG